MRLDTIEGAIRFATQAHDGQMDKQGMPYILHPLRVGARLYDFGDTYVIAGILHDVIEDTPHTLDDLRALGAHPDVIEAVDLLTRHDRHEPYVSHVALVAGNHVAAWVKASDMADNVSRLDALEEPDRERLLRKYTQGIDILTSLSEADPGRFL